MTTVADRVGIVVRSDAAQPWQPGMRLPAPPVMVTRHGGDVARWVREAVLAVRLAVIAATAPEGAPLVAVPRPLPGGYFVWHPLITGALLATPGLRVDLVGARWVERAGHQRLAGDGSPARCWSDGYPPQLIGPGEQSGRGTRAVLRAAWDVAGGAGLWLAERDGEAT